MANDNNSKQRAAAQSLVALVLIAACVVVLNLLGLFGSFGRFDLTKNSLFSLAPTSERLVKDLSDTLEVRAYFTQDLPAPFNATEREVRDLLGEYQAASSGKMTVTFVNPDSEETKEKAGKDGIQAVQHQSIENDASNVVMGYRGLFLQYLDRKKTIPLVQSSRGLEYTLTMAIKELVGEKTKIGVVTGHEMPTLSEGLTSLKGRLPTYAIQEVSATEPLDPALEAVLIVSPKSELTEVELKHINTYVMQGGSLGVFAGGVQVGLEGPAPSASAVNSGLNRLLQGWGVTIGDNLVADFQCQRAPMAGPLGLRVLVAYPPVPIVTFGEEEQAHTMIAGLASTVLPFVSALTIQESGDGHGVTVSSVAKSSENSWLLTGSAIGLDIRDPREWRPSGETGPFSLGVAIEGALPSAFSASEASEGTNTTESAESASKSPDTRVFVAGTGTFVTDQFVPPPGQGQGGEFAFALNAVDWLAAEEDLVAIRAKNIEEPPLDTPTAVQLGQADQQNAVENQDREAFSEATEKTQEAIKVWDAKKDLFRWGNTVGIPLLFLFLGFLRYRWRMAKKANVNL